MKLMPMPIIAGAIAMLAASCAPNTPAARIDRNPGLYEALPAEHRKQVREGRIDRGMSEDAVLLAWGRPSRQLEMVRPEGPAVRWDYTGSRPVYASNFHGGYRRGRLGACCHYSAVGFGFGPEIIHVPTHRASVWFVDGKVEAWESVR